MLQNVHCVFSDTVWVTSRPVCFFNGFSHAHHTPPMTNSSLIELHSFCCVTFCIWYQSILLVLFFDLNRSSWLILFVLFLALFVHHDRPYLFFLIYLICLAFQARAVVDYLPSPYDRDALRFSKEIWRKTIKLVHSKTDSWWCWIAGWHNRHNCHECLRPLAWSLCRPRRKLQVCCFLNLLKMSQEVLEFWSNCSCIQICQRWDFASSGTTAKQESKFEAS